MVCSNNACPCNSSCRIYIVSFELFWFAHNKHFAHCSEEARSRRRDNKYSLFDFNTLSIPSITHRTPVMLFLLAIPPILFLLQSSTAILFIRNAIVNIVFLIFLLLQDFWTATQYFYTNFITSATAHNLRNYILQRVIMTTQSFCAIITRFCRTLLVGTAETIWSIWSLQDRVRARILPALNRNATTLSPPSDSSIKVRCMGFTDGGQCEREKIVEGGGVWYCFQHKRQGTHVHV